MVAPAAVRALVPVATVNLAEGMRKIRARVTQQRKQENEKRREEENQILEWQQRFLSDVPSVFPGIPAENLCSSAAAGTNGLHGYLRWVPPCTEFAKVMGLPKKECLGLGKKDDVLHRF